VINKSFDKIDEQDVINLKTNSVQESKTIEYKKLLNLSSKENKIEFLADISSFSNTNGGDLLVGISEKKGIPDSIDGIEIDNPDKEINKLESIIRDGIEPNIVGIEIKFVKLTNLKRVMIIRIPRSWNLPHRIVYKGYDKFYARNNSGKYPMDVGELRNTFNLSSTLYEEIQRFKTNRVLDITTNESTNILVDGAKIIMHLLPLSSFSPAKHYNLSDIYQNPGFLKPIYCSARSHRINFDGFISYQSFPNSNKINTYVQLYKNGIIEAVDNGLLRFHSNIPTISIVLLENEIIKALNNYIEVLKSLSVDYPIMVYISMINVKGYQLYSEEFRIRGSKEIENETLYLPEFLLENNQISIENLLKNTFDSIWNACGYRGSSHYDKQGNWIDL